MYASLISAAFALGTAAPAAAGPVPSLLPTAPEADAAPSRLAPLDAASPWTPRFEEAAARLLSALQSRDESRWLPLLGGQWLAASDRKRVAALLNDRDTMLHAALFDGSAPRRQVLLGWQPPATYSADDKAALAARPEAEAIVCWSSVSDTPPVWPRTADEAVNRPGRSYACARIAYSLRGAEPSWRAFIEQAPHPS